MDLLPHLNIKDHSAPHAIQEAARHWAEVDQDGFTEWLETVDDPNVRKPAVQALVIQLAGRDPKRALEVFAAEVAHFGDYRHLDSAREILENLKAAGEDPRTVIGSLLESARSPLFESYARLFAIEAPAETVAFMESQPASRTQERALQEALSR